MHDLKVRTKVNRGFVSQPPCLSPLAPGPLLKNQPSVLASVFCFTVIK